MTNELNQWEKALPEGKLAEAAFAILMQRHMGMTVIPNNTENVRTEDCKVEFVADVKVLQAPYPSQRTPAGLDKDEHLTFDLANIDKYPDNTVLAIIADYSAAGTLTEGFYFIPVKRVREIIKEHPERVYTRSARTNRDKSVKVGISTRECSQIRFGEMTGRETAKAFIEMMNVLRAREARRKEAKNE